MLFATYVFVIVATVSIWRKYCFSVEKYSDLFGNSFRTFPQKRNEKGGRKIPRKQTRTHRQMHIAPAHTQQTRNALMHISYAHTLTRAMHAYTRMHTHINTNACTHTHTCMHTAQGHS